MRIVLVDNYDSFSYNLVQYLGELGAQLQVVRNDEVTVQELRARAPDGIVISPGPSAPDQAGISMAAIREFAGEVPVLGVCLGHQAIGQCFGGKVVRNHRVVHGKASPVIHEGQGVFASVPSPFAAGRYHSLVVERESLPAELEVTAWTAEGEIMGLKHRRFDVEGIQFHPESILTEHGKTLLAGWLQRVAARRAA